jgi:para-nitrobenzyl esterase
MKVRAATVRAYRAALPGATPGEVLGQIVTDRLLRAPAVRIAGARTAPTYVYEFAWRSPVRELWAAHAVEIAFVFGAVEAPVAAPLVGTEPPRDLADRMHGDWVRFASAGDPGWSRYGAERGVQIYHDETRVEPLRRAAAVDTLTP